MKYKMKPVEVEAVKWNGDNLDEVKQLVDGAYTFNGCLFIKGHSGKVVDVNRDQYIVKNKGITIMDENAFLANFEPTA